MNLLKKWLKNWCKSSLEEQGYIVTIASEQEEKENLYESKLIEATKVYKENEKILKTELSESKKLLTLFESLLETTIETEVTITKDVFEFFGVFNTEDSKEEVFEAYQTQIKDKLLEELKDHLEVVFTNELNLLDEVVLKGHLKYYTQFKNNEQTS